ncbi:hypothetical protein OB69_11390 [Roseivirga seohaensis subsp. aquiponti]|uniref:Uncharacterized protein n=1 Tax=Roseivirga seohaensis subsp. aquiponti TaxID=1566026 RepID=A0A0L8AJW6_9BACT|nr:AHH domain-containing protein [Roseivirga seohaensis]KOF02527.1 hypothetical protein OB69_11390 [Roseivirga seohaensis subsp. aquiponti]
MKKIKFYFLILLLFAVFGCQTSDTETVPEIPKMKAQYKNPDALPEVMSQLNSALKTNVDTRGSANTGQVITSIGKISIDRIFEVIDTVKNSNYTFLVEDEDNNPFTFTNLVLKKREGGDWDTPYLIDYKVDSAEIPQFIESGFSMANFTGTTTKRFLKDFSFGPRSSANLEQRAGVSDPSQCDQQTGYEGGNSGGGSDSDYPPNNEPPSGGGYTSFCYHYIEEIEVDACGTEISGQTGIDAPDFENNGCNDADYYNALYGNGSGKTKTITVRRTYCYTIGPSYSIGDPDACPQPETEDVGVINPLLSSTRYLNRLMSLDGSQIAWLENNPEISFELADIVSADGEFDENGFLTEATTLAAQSLLDLTKSGLLEGSYTPAYVFKISPYTLHLYDPSLFTAYLSLEVAFLVAEHSNDPEWFTDFPNRVWNTRKLYFEASLNAFQTLLDLGGLAPVVGEVFDVINGGIYLVRGDGVNAALSFSAAVPIAGWVATGAKFATKGPLRWVLKADGYIDFGRSSKLRKIIGLADGDKTVQAHHILVWAEQKHTVIQKAASSSTNPFHMNDILNGIPVATWRNQPNHNAYNQRVRDALDAIDRDFPSLTPDEAVNKLKPLIQRIRQAILDNPNTHINDIIF